MTLNNRVSFRSALLWMSFCALSIVLAGCKTGFGRSGENDLERLTVTNATITPSFSKSETEYKATVSVSVTSVTFNATAESDLATMTINGVELKDNINSVQQLSLGKNTFRIEVTAENESTKTYEFEITQLESTSKDANLNSFTLENLTVTPVFSASQLTYSAQTNFFVNSTRVSAVKSDDLLATLTVGTQRLSNNELSDALALAAGADTTVTLEMLAGDQITEQDYVVTVSRSDVDALAVPHYIKASDSETEDRFGQALALDGTTLVVGAPFEDGTADNAGAAYVFTGASGNWVQAARLKADTVTAGDTFGSAVAVFGDIVAVGSPANNESRGSVDIFKQSGSAWNYSATITAADASAGDAFGSALSLVDGQLAIGAPGRDSDKGAVYIYERDGDEWDAVITLEANNGAAGDNFGHSLHLDFESDAESAELIVGAPFEDGSALDNSGAAYVFTRDDDAWEETAYLKAENTGANDEFGTAVQIRTNRIAVSAPKEASNAVDVNGTETNDSIAGAGAVYTFERDNRADTTWEEQDYFKASQARAINFGQSLALSSDMLAVGATLEDSSAIGINGEDDSTSELDAGAVYVFEFAESVWTSDVYVKSSNTDAGDRFGAAIAMEADILVVAADREDSGTNGIDSTPDEDQINAGAVYVVE